MSYKRTHFVIYKLTNTTTGKTYTGVTGNYDVRIQLHFSSLKRNDHKCKALQADYNNGHQFEAKIIRVVKQHERWKKEKEYVDNNTYNIRPVSNKSAA